MIISRKIITTLKDSLFNNRKLSFSVVIYNEFDYFYHFKQPGRYF